MIRLSDAIILAGTKLRAHRVRTGIITGVSGVLFGLLIGLIIIAQGVFDSASEYGSVRLGDRYIVAASSYGADFRIHDYLEDEKIIERIEQAHSQMIAKKQAAAKKYGVVYDPKTEDPSPIDTDSSTGRKIININMLHSPSVLEIRVQENQKTASSTIIEDKIKPYKSVKVIGEGAPIMPDDGNLSFMKEGKEQAIVNEETVQRSRYGPMSNEDRSLIVLPQTIANSFVANKDYNPNSGELPLILPYGDIEKSLGLKRLSAEASPGEQRIRMQEIQDRMSEVRVSFCYRNQASMSLLEQAKSTAAEIEKNKNNKDYQKPSLIYSIPDETSCGPVEISSDTRTNAEKLQADNHKAYLQEIGDYLGEPEQHKLVFRAVGVSADMMTGPQASAASVLYGMLSSPLGYGVWNIPAGLLGQVPESAKPAAVFDNQSSSGFQFVQDTKLLEFSDVDEARSLVNSIDYAGTFYAMPFGSSSIVVEEMKHWFGKILFWAVIVVGVVAVIILSGLVGRTIADSRRETAVFRSIGATRSDISSIYILYTLLFSIRVVLFAFVLGLILALVVHFMFTESATIGADLAYGAIGDDLQFNLLGFGSLYLPIIAGVIVAVGLVSVAMPILRNVRRNPINDMRDE